MTTLKEDVDTCNLQPILRPTVDHHRDNVLNDVKPSTAQLLLSNVELWKQKDLSSFPSISTANFSNGNAGGNVENLLSFESSPCPVLFVKNRATTNTSELCRKPIFQGKQVNSDETCLVKKPDTATQPSETETGEMGLDQSLAGRIVGHLDIKTEHSDEFVLEKSERAVGHLDTVSCDDKSCCKMEDSVITDCDPNDCNLVTAKPSAFSQHLSTCEEPELDDEVNYGDSYAKHLDISSQRRRTQSRQTKCRKDDDAQTQTMSVKDVHACLLCKLVFSSNQCLESHMEIRHNGKYCGNVKESIRKKSSVVGFDCFEDENRTLSKSVKCCTNEKGGMEAVEQLNDYFKKSERLEQSMLSKGEESMKSEGSGQNASQNVKLYSNATLQGERLVECSECCKMFSQESDHIDIMERINESEREVSKCNECYRLSNECGKRFTQNSQLHSHMRTDTGEKPFKRNECGETFSHIRNLQCHMRRHTAEKLLRCNECDQPFISNSHLHYHMRTHTGDKAFKCDECGQMFSRRSGLSGHMRKHTGEKLLKCNECGKTFVSSGPLHDHMRSHTGDKPFKCNECGKMFSLNTNLNSHMRTHTGYKPFKCNECGKVFSNNSTLKNHMRTHTGDKPFKCNVCGKTLSRSNTLKNHMTTHTGEKPFKCHACGNTFTQNCDLKRHMRTHTREKPFECNECGKMYTQNSSLRSHMRTHTGEQPFECNECGKMFTYSSGLRSHMRTHTRARPFKCNECGKMFAQNSALYSHMRTHRGEKPFECNDCGKIFTQNSALHRHEITHIVF